MKTKLYIFIELKNINKTYLLYGIYSLPSLHCNFNKIFKTKDNDAYVCAILAYYNTLGTRYFLLLFSNSVTVC